MNDSTVRMMPIRIIARCFAYIVCAAVIFSSAPVWAQTAEEAVAMMIFGYELGRREIMTLEEMKREIATPVPADQYIVKLDVTKRDKCRYSFQVETPTREIQISFDLTNLSEIGAEITDRNPHQIVVKGRNLFKALIRNKQGNREERQEGNEFRWFAELHVSIDRVKRAETYFRRSFCKGRPF